MSVSPAPDYVSASSFPSMEVRCPHHLFNTHHLIRRKLPRVFCFKFISPSPIFLKGGEVKQLQKGLRQNKQNTEKTVAIVAFLN